MFFLQYVLLGSMAIDGIAFLFYRYDFFVSSIKRFKGHLPLLQRSASACSSRKYTSGAHQETVSLFLAFLPFLPFLSFLHRLVMVGDADDGVVFTNDGVRDGASVHVRQRIHVHHFPERLGQTTVVVVRTASAKAALSNGGSNGRGHRRVLFGMAGRIGGGRRGGTHGRFPSFKQNTGLPVLLQCARTLFLLFLLRGKGTGGTGGTGGVVVVAGASRYGWFDWRSVQRNRDIIFLGLATTTINQKSQVIETGVAKAGLKESIVP